MGILNKINTAKNSTLIVFALVLATWWIFIPWVSFAISDLSDWLLSMVAHENPFRVWWGDGFLFFCVLTAVQLIALTLMSFCLLRVLYRRWKAGIARFWQFIAPMVIVGLAGIFMTIFLSISYIEISKLRGGAEQVDIADEVFVSGQVFAQELEGQLRSAIDDSVRVTVKDDELEATISSSAKYPFLAGATVLFRNEGSPEMLVRNLLSVITVQFPDNVALEKKLLTIDMQFGNKIFFGFEE